AVDGCPHGRRGIVSDEAAGLGSLEQTIADFLPVEAATTNNLKEIEGGGIERVVARSRLRGLDRLALAIERRARPDAGLLAAGKLDQPLGRRDRLIGVGIPAVHPAVSGPGRRKDSVPALAPDVDAGANPAGAVANLGGGAPVPGENPMLAPARGKRRQGFRQFTTLCGELRERRLAVDLLDRIDVVVEHTHVTHGPVGRRGSSVRQLRPQHYVHRPGYQW